MDSDNREDRLKEIAVDSRLIAGLYSQGKISLEAKRFALDLLSPHHRWGLWVSRLLLSIGTTLVLSGIIYFFAFNWMKITPMMKLSSIEMGLIACLIGSCCYSLQRLNGQVEYIPLAYAFVCALCSSVLFLFINKCFGP